MQQRVSSSAGGSLKYSGGLSGEKSLAAKQSVLNPAEAISVTTFSRFSLILSEITTGLPLPSTTLSHLLKTISAAPYIWILAQFIDVGYQYLFRFWL